MTWQVEIDRPALKQIAALDRLLQRRIMAAIDKLGLDPRPPGCRKVVTTDLWRIRVGDHRIKYAVVDERLVVFVVEVVHRSRAY
ncbi:type II toxin-antitoxin system RelE family toxin [Micromonospora sp. DT227]|uniref:type II toxin-antitoxin system RelE family toxin n=1 Tax=Micromonospora sp. DT227 TaxID=3393433 RepID=UPI003CF8E032